jgi:hypothetical protein
MGRPGAPSITWVHLKIPRCTSAGDPQAGRCAFLKKAPHQGAPGDLQVHLGVPTPPHAHILRLRSEQGAPVERLHKPLVRTLVPHCEDGTGAPHIPPSLHDLHAVHVPTEPLAHTLQPRQDFDPRHQTRHPDHRDLHCTSTDAMAWARVVDAGDAARHEIESPKRPPKKSAQGRLPLPKTVSIIECLRPQKPWLAGAVMGL